MKFYSSYNPAPSLPHEPCPVEIDDYIRDEATGELIKCGTIPTYERTQSYHESSCLSFKLKRFAMGDRSALGSVGGSFGDFTKVPTDLRSILDSRQKVVEDFNSLDSELRGIFDDSFDEFEKSVRDGTAERRIYEYNKSKASTTGKASNPGGTVEGGAN